MRIVYQLLLSQPRSYGQARGLIEGITDRVLTQQLCELKDDGILTSQREGRLVRYCLTNSSRSLIAICQAMLVWGEARQAELSGTDVARQRRLASWLTDGIERIAIFRRQPEQRSCGVPCGDGEQPNALSLA